MDRDQFYRAFEDRYRGSRDVIKSRQKIYLKFLEPLNQNFDNGTILDLGCGRGEWLELLRENGYNASGVDLDSHMLEVCRSMKLSVEVDDAISTLKNLDAESQICISAFHLVEHLPFNIMMDLIEESLRVLKPGGLLILETPNPENIVVGATTFHLDPTHKKPLPPQLLSFAAEFCGFSRVKIVRLNEDKNLLREENISIFSVFNAVSPDYSIIAQKAAPSALMNKFNALFQADYGISLVELCHYYQSHTDRKIADLISLVGESQSELAETKARYQAVIQSRSWQITKPIRWLIRTVKKGTTVSPKEEAINILRAIGRQVRSSPGATAWALRVLSPFPELRDRIIQLASQPIASEIEELKYPTDEGDLTPSAHIIFDRFKELKAKSQEAQ